MNNKLVLPMYAKASLLCVGLYFFVSILIIAQGIILPVIYATILAMLISPIVNFLVRKGVGRALAVSIVLLVFLVVLLTLIGLVLSQASLLKDALPQLTDKFGEVLNQGVRWASKFLDISVGKINKWLSNAKTELLADTNGAIGSTLSVMGGWLATIFLTPVYMFMLLFYQPHIIQFVHRVFGKSNNVNVTEVLSVTRKIVQSYLVGLSAEMAIVAVLNSIGLLILGIDYAILLGILGAMLNVIPYIGGLVAVLLFMVIALVTKTPAYVLYVFVLYAIIQFVDNNYIVPRIVGSRVKINALTALFAVIAGAALWGIPGMFLAIPITAIVKLVSDRIDSLKPWGFLLGSIEEPIKSEPVTEGTDEGSN